MAEAINQSGLITIENLPEEMAFIGDLGLQVAEDGRIWVCINGAAFLRFKPIKKKGQKNG